MKNISLLIIDQQIERLMETKLKLPSHIKLFTATTVSSGLTILNDYTIHCVIIDISDPGQIPVNSICEIQRHFPGIDIVIAVDRIDTRCFVEGIKLGAIDYIKKPFVSAELKALIDRLSKCWLFNERYNALIESKNNHQQAKPIIFKSKSMLRLLNQAKNLRGHSHANVLITGETGTGKELLARYINRMEDDPARPFIAVNCAAIPEHLLEAELFGAEAGSYTGAVKRRIGKFELAHDGDIFLDEICSLKIDLQAKILRVIQEQSFCRVGGNEVISSSFRVIAASNEPLLKKVKCREFREDLYHRIHVIELFLPPLRNRLEDIPALADYYLRKFARSEPPKRLTELASDYLLSYSWPGNIREFANVIQSLHILTPGTVIDKAIFPAWVMNGTVIDESVDPSNSVGIKNMPHVQGMALNQKTNVNVKRIPSINANVNINIESLKKYLIRAERYYIDHALALYSGDKTLVARKLDIGRTTLYMKLKELGLMC